MKKITIILTAFIAALIMSAVSVFAQVNAPVLPNDPAVVKGKLPNGMTYYIRHNAKPEGRAEFYLATNVGAIQEAPDQDGLAHFLEHMCFNGTKNFPGKNLLNYLESIGASFGGNINAQTGVEETTYMLNNIPVAREGVVDTCLLIMHDYSHFVTNSAEEIDKERGVILEERRSRRNAQWRMHEKALPYLFKDSKYATCTVIGEKESLETFKPESIRNFYKTWYRPDMQALIVVGDIDPVKIEAKIKDIFSDIPAAENPRQKDIIKVADNKEPLVAIITDPEASMSSIDVIWKRPAMPEELNNTIIGFSSDYFRIITQLVMAERLSDIATKPDSPFLNSGLFITNLCETMENTYGVVHFKEGEALPAFKAFLLEVKKAEKYGFSQAEIDRAKQNILSSAENAVKSADSRQNSQFVQPLISNFFDNESYMEPETELELVKQLSAAIGSDNINAYLKSNFVSDTNMVVIYQGPEKEGVTHPTEQQILNVVSEVAKTEIKPNEEVVSNEPLLDASKLKGSKIIKEEESIYGAKKWTLENGVTIYALKTDYQKDNISMNLFKAGGKSLVDDEDLLSVDGSIWSSYFSMAGVSNFDRSQLGKMLAGKDVSTQSYIDGLYNGVSGSAVRKDLETAMQLMYLEYTQPRFDQPTFDMIIDRLKSVLPNMENQPSYKMNQAITKGIYGENQPRAVDVNSKNIDKVSLQVLEKNYRKLFNNAAGLNMIVVGDFDEATLKEYCQKYIGSLPKGNKSSKWIDRKVRQLPGKREIHFAEDMQTPQTTVFRLYKNYGKYDTKVGVALNAAKYILDMIYVETLREDEGGTYGAQVMSSGTRQPKESSSVMVYFNTKPSAADKLLNLATEGIENLAKNGPTEEQFNKTILHFKKQIPESRISNSYWKGNIYNYILFGKDNDKEYEEALNKLTPKDVSKALSKILKSGNFVEVVMEPANSAEAE